jgi:hypothetical protein
MVPSVFGLRSATCSIEKAQENSGDGATQAAIPASARISTAAQGEAAWLCPDPLEIDRLANRTKIRFATF